MEIKKLVVLVCTILTAPAQVYQLDPARSEVTLSGTAAGLTIQEQGPGSLRTVIDGAVALEITSDSIQFLPATILDARTNGDWLPSSTGTLETAPADFGAQAASFVGTMRGALREIVLNLNSEAIPLDNGSFDASQVLFSFPTDSESRLDYNAPLVGAGSEPLAGNATNHTATTGTLTRADGVETLVITVDTTFTVSLLNPNDSSFRFQGQIVATRPIGPVFTSIQIIDGEVRLTVDQAEDGLDLQTSADLNSWDETPAVVTELDADTRVYTVPLSGGARFFRLAQI